jgi:FkbM family methyltransferase
MAAFLGHKVTNRAEADNLFGELVGNTVWLGREWFGLKRLEFAPRDGSPLQVQDGSTVKLICDYVMGPTALRRHCWQLSELEFAKRLNLSGELPITLVDVGANMGLFSRQLLIALPAISKVFCYEPEHENFDCLSHNLAPFADKVEMIEAAVTKSRGEAEFYLDGYNSGNFSLALSAMPKRHKKTIVKTVNVADECTAWLGGGSRIFYKSDTEGFDEWIATLIAPAVWARTVAGIMELWRIPGRPSLDVVAFSSILNSFPHKIFLGNADTGSRESSVTTTEVLDYINGTADETHRDLAFWR